MTEPQPEQTNTNPILPIHTSCKECVFATYREATQVGCSFQNRIEKYRELGLVVEARDEEQEFFIVNGRHCNAFRRDEPKNWDENPQHKVREEIKLHIDVIVPFETGATTVDLLKTVRSVQRQSLPFKRLYVVSNQDAVKPSALVSLLNTHGTHIPWYVTNVQERHQDGSRVDTNRALSHAADKVEFATLVGEKQKATRHFYVVVPPGGTLPEDLCQKLDELVNDKLEQLTVLIPDETNNVLVVHAGFHSFADNSRPMTVSIPGVDGAEPVHKVLTTIAEKAEFFAEAQNLPDMVRKVSSLWNN